MSFFLHTIDSDEEVEAEVVSEDEEKVEEKGRKPAKADKKKRSLAAPAVPVFALDFDDGNLFRATDKVRSMPPASKMQAHGEDEEEGEEGEEEGDEGDEGDDDDDYGVGPDEAGAVRAMPRTEERATRAQEKASRSEGKKRKHRQEEDEEQEAAAAAQEAAYFDSVLDAPQPEGIMFSQLNLSRPLLRAIEAAGYVSPTPVQAKVIPLALAGRDVCASAVTGSGKTAAFVLPFLERLLYKPKDIGAIRVLVVTPTRELATQIYEVLQKLARFTSVTCCLVSGGKKDLKSQAVMLRQRPDVVVGTPGRIIDHLRNSASVTVDELDVLVLDEVDRLLDLGFQEEIEELVRHCPESRQTLLFSATMTTKVEDLVRLSLRRPVRVKTEGGVTTVAPRLVQEFVRVRKDDEREAMLASLICRVFTKRVIVFYEMKKDAHRFFAVLMLLGVRAAELHGDLPQVQRDLALQRFRDGDADVLVATDVAARGLDIKDVKAVINAEMPRSASTYVHRVGRTARAGSGGVAVTLVGEARRKVVTEVLKGEGASLSAEGGRVLNRTIAPAVVTKFVARIEGLESKIDGLFQEEKMRARLDVAMREADRAQNLLEHEEEIEARPARTWYQSETQKQASRTASRMRAKDEELEASVGKAQAAVEKQSALEKAEAQARADDYRREEKELSKEHKLSRKKRRRLEALREGGPRDKEGEAKSRDEDARMMRAAAKKNKVQTREEEKRRKDLTTGDIKLGGERKQGHKDAHGKIVRQKFAVGGLDRDMADWGGSSEDGPLSKKAKRTLAKEKEFTDFDGSKRLKKGGKAGAAAFKSKSKFKRKH